jgi:hypothetical protein
MLSRPSVRILPDEYASFLAAIKNDARLPATYEDWIKRIRDQDAHNVARNGEVIKEVVINFEEFAAYCEARGQQPCYDVLMALVIAKAAGIKS